MLGRQINTLADELFYSYLYRLALINGVSFGRLSQYIMGGHVNSFDISRRVDRFFDVFNADNNDIVKIFMETSIIHFEGISWSEAQRGKYINNCFRDISLTNTPTNRLIDNIRICPVCNAEAKAQYGCDVFYRSHNLTGVKVCWKHKVPLLKSVNTMPFVNGIVREYQEVAVNDLNLAYEYALFAHNVVYAGYDLTLENVRKILVSRLDDIGIDSNDVFGKRFSRSKYSRLYIGKVPIESFYGYMQWSRKVLIQSLVSVLLYTYRGRPESFLSDCIKYGLNRPIIWSVSHLCGKPYILTAWAEKAGFGCPYCDKQDDLIRKVVSNIGDGKYILKENRDTVCSNREFIHKVCGRVIKMDVSHFIYGGRRCKCENRVAGPEAKQKVADTGDYELIDFTSTSKKCTVRHLACGKSFMTDYHHFIAKPNCSVCNGKPDAEVYRKRLKEVCGSEYSLVDISMNIDYKNKIAIKHNACGQTHSYYMLRFMQGQRCPYCSRESTVKEVYSSLKVTYGINDIILAEDVEVDGLDKDQIGTALYRLVQSGKLRSVGIGCYVFAERENDVSERQIVEAKYVRRKGKIVGYYALGYGSSIRICSNKATYDMWDKRVQGNTLYYVCRSRVKDLDDKNILFLPVLDRLANQRISKIEIERLTATLCSMRLPDKVLEPYLKLYPAVVSERLKKGSINYVL